MSQKGAFALESRFGFNFLLTLNKCNIYIYIFIYRKYINVVYTLVDVPLLV